MDKKQTTVIQKTVGDGVIAVFDTETGALELHAHDGILWHDWLERAHISKQEVKSIRVAEGKVFLPEDSGKTHMYGWIFSHLKNLRTIDLTNFDTSKVTSMKSMFYNCPSLKEIDM